MSEALETLKTIQAHDQQVRELQAQISSLGENIARLERSEADETERVEQAKQRLSQLQHQSRERNAEVDDLDTQLRKYQQQLDQGLLSFKEMEALRTKLAHDRPRMEQLEDEALALMDEAGSVAVRVQEEEEALSSLKAEIAQEIQAIRSQIAAAQSKIAKEQAEREALTQQVPSLLLERYRHLSRDYADPLVPVRAGSCGGCKLKLSETTLSRVREGLDLVTCENCSRILISG